MSLVDIPTGENTRDVRHVSWGVGVNPGAVGTAFFATVQIQFSQPDGHELHDFAAVVFVWRPARGSVFFAVAFGVQEVTHCRVERYGL